MAVNGTEYRTWKNLALRDDVPPAAFPALVAGLIPSQEDAPLDTTDWQHAVFQKALPHLLARIDDQGLRDQLLAAAGSTYVSEALRNGALPAGDLPGVVRRDGATPTLLAAMARHDQHRDAVLEAISGCALEGLPGIKIAAECYLTNGNLPVVPEWLLDAVLERALHLVAAELEAFVSVPQRVASHPWWSPSQWPDFPIVAMLLEARPQRWLELARDAVVGQAVRHTLLDLVDTKAVSDDVLAACMPALDLPEWRELPSPAASQSRRLHAIAERVRQHPRLRAMAADVLNRAADECITRGRLLATNKSRQPDQFKVVALAKDLALTTTNADCLALMCTRVSGLPRPIVMERRYEYGTDDTPPSPRLLLSSDTRAGAVTELARNPHLELEQFTGLLEHLHPVEVDWLLAHGEELPDHIVEAAADYQAMHFDREIVRILSDDELDDLPDPQSVMQNWLDLLNGHRGAFNYQVEYTVLKSRHRTEHLLRQLPSDIVLSCYEQEVAQEAVLRLCASDPERWQTMMQWLTTQPDSSETWGQFLDRFEREVSSASTPADA
ncbi:hypothetical protein [Streptomyces sp. NPDC058385]|uniref:hypothetical protein n=1 Tax=Streptomyces sp. NPDC058385 TaxID=3346473 RepID=UPI0036581DF0